MAKANDISFDFSYDSIDDKKVIYFITEIRKGFTFSTFQNFAKHTPFTLVEWSKFLNMSQRTMQRHRKVKKRFNPAFSERILQIAMLYNLGIEVFANRDKFNAWLESKNLALGNIKPKELLDNSFGIGLVKDELGRIEHGILA
ncbi:type II RES/Xre toxin-antitoxin system antitoxin [Terrimonas ferruginea]|uniref:type II RES/Xre toxin-antitoxin system antitoxin n=1 Tax=Terrimonas ferruginea TaxID=249 RepID=UPI00048D5BBB|nr:antitoxin Xre/MbcA/ParS toxin-binding domain-containing protein [Terrimonas ferruginea]